MAEGWLVQESCVYVTEYLSRPRNVDVELWSTLDDDRVVSDVPQGKGVVKRFSEDLRTKVSNYCMMNSEGMQKWYDMYESVRQEQIDAREEWKEANQSNRYPEWLPLLPKSMSLSWLRARMETAKAAGEIISLDEQEYAIGPDWHVSPCTATDTFSAKFVCVILGVIRFVLVRSIALTMPCGHEAVIFEWKK